MATTSKDITQRHETEKTRAAWDAIAAAYDEHVTAAHDWTMSTDALRRAGVGPGSRVLDVASGSGALAIPAARLGARVLAVDLSPIMIDRLRARAREEGLSELEARVMDGHSLDLEDGSFDVAASQFGVMLFPGLPRALREMARVTRRGGHVLMVAYGPPSEVEFLSFFLSAMRAVVPGFTGLPADSPPLPFQVADPEVLRTRMAEAGLRDVGVERASERLPFRTGDEMWRWVVSSNPISVGMTADLGEDERAEVQRVLDGMLRERSLEGPAVLKNAVHIAVGRK